MITPIIAEALKLVSLFTVALPEYRTTFSVPILIGQKMLTDIN